jgi:hypothetical protein
LHACSFTLCLSFSYLRSAVAASFDIKSSTGTLQYGEFGTELLVHFGIM